MPEAARREVRRLLAALALMLPAGIPYALHFLDQRPYSRPTGYIQPDMPLYMAKARETFDAGGFGVFYGNPCEALSDGPRLYFQPWTFALGLAHRITEAPPGVLWVAFWFVSAWAASRVALALYEEYVGLESRSKKLGLVAFLWGGGVLAASGAVLGLMDRGSIGPDDLTRLDPFGGWWFLNLGRNLVYPTESLYHALAFGSFLMAARGRFTATLGLLALTMACSPFAGLEALAILWLWGLGGLLLARRGPFWECGGLPSLSSVQGCTRAAASRRTPKTGGFARSAAFFAGVNVLALLFFGYYLGWLNRFPEHRVLSRQMALPWRYDWATPAAAYGPILVFAVMQWARQPRLDSRQRLLIAWAIAAFALENHDWLIAPRQPIHFTRGYVWSALFLLGAPLLVELFDRIGRMRAPWGRLLRLALLGAIVSDNAAWLAGLVGEYQVPDRNGLRLNAEQAAVLRRLDSDDLRGSILVSEDERLSYLALAETRLRSWVGHPLETPDYRLRRDEAERLFAEGLPAPAWSGRPLVVVLYRRATSDTPAWALRGRPVFEGRRLQILQFCAGLEGATPESVARRGDGRE